MTVGFLPIPVRRATLSRRGADLAAAGLIALVGVLFNLARLKLRLDRGPLWTSLIAFAAFGLLALAIGKVRSLSRGDLGATAPLTWPAVVGGALASITLLGTALATAPMIRVPAATEVVQALLLFGFFTAPAEELMFRGVMFALLERNGGPLAAVALTSLAFAVAHVPVYGLRSFPLALVAGLLLGWLRWWSRSIAPAMVVHAAADMGLIWL